MKVFERINELVRELDKLKLKGNKIGLVPTMGYLHSGHASLVTKSVADNDVTVVTIFVNPTQFGANEDLSSYPKDIEADKKLLNSLGVDIVFAPTAEEMYPEELLTKIFVSSLSKKLCGITRPHHFEGVTLVVSKLFNIVRPTNAYFGSKDLQQLQIVKKMVKDLNFQVNVIGMPIIRDNDGLALSSRNSYLSDNERKSSLSLSKALKDAHQAIENDELNAFIIKEKIKSTLAQDDLIKIDYIKIINLDTLEDIERIENNSAILLAAYVNTTRLIDNLIVDFI